jgi:hypothetical protein
MSQETVPNQPVSTALLANLAETRREVVIPAAYDPLRQAVAPYFGVLQSLDRLLTELFHPLRNLAEVNSQLVRLCGGMFHYFEQSEARAELGGLLAGVFPALYARDGRGVLGTVGTTSPVDTLSSRAAEYGAVVNRAPPSSERSRDLGALSFCATPASSG